MPESKSKHPHKHAHSQPHSIVVTNKINKKNSTVIIALGLFVGVLGLGISYFISGSNAAGLLLGMVTGAIIGGVFGYLIDKNLSKK